MVDDHEGTDRDKMPNAMRADSEDDFGLWSRFCAFATQHIKNQTVDEDMIEQHGDSAKWHKNNKKKGDNEATGKLAAKRKRGRPRKLPLTIVEDVEEEGGGETLRQIVEDVFDEDVGDESDTDDEGVYSVHDTEESEVDQEGDEEVEQT